MHVNHFADMKDSDFMRLHGSVVPDIIVKENSKVPHKHTEHHYKKHPEDRMVEPDVMIGLANSTVPEYKNWFDEGAVTKPIDQ